MEGQQTSQFTLVIFFFLSHKNELKAASWLVDERVSVGMDRFNMNTGFLVSSFRRMQGSEVR